MVRMRSSAVATDTNPDDESVDFVHFSPSPTIEPATPSDLSTLSSLSSSPSIVLDTSAVESGNEASNERVSAAIPTPKSTATIDTSPPPQQASSSPSSNVVSPSRRSAMENPQAQDSCMFCTSESAPPGENLEWIQCNGCKRWSHTLCTGLVTSIDISSIDKFHCKRCEKTRGPTTCAHPQAFLELTKLVRPPPRKSERSHVNIDYTSLNLGDTTNILPDQHAYNVFFEGDAPRKFAPDRFKRMWGHELTKEWAEETGCKEPVVIPRGQEDGMGMVMPTDLTVRKVSELVGPDTKVEVIDVPTQKEAPNWKLKQWADYYDSPPEQRDRVRNVISLEVSSSSLGAQVVRPQLVRDLDLIEKVWPKHLRPTSPASANPGHAPVLLPNPNNTPSAITFPKVTLYCLMSVARAYTDFHIDFGGSSVFYHVLRGNKTFLFIEPTATNLRRYEAWCGDSNQSRRFLGEEVKECIRVDLTAGDTMIIPSGWIHAVYTPTDSLVLGGNFLTSLHIPSQLNIAAIETRTRVPKKFRFPFFDMAMWYTAIYYLDGYAPRKKPGPKPKGGRPNTDGMTDDEVAGLKSLSEWLWKKAKLRTQQIAKGPDFHRAKVEVPPGIDAMEVATRFARWVYDADIDGGEEIRDLPTWYRNEVLMLKQETPKKRKREESDEPVRKYIRRSIRKRRDEGRQAVDVIAPSSNVESLSLDYFSLSRPVITYSSTNCMSQPSTTYPNWAEPVQFPLVTYRLPKNFATSQPLNIFKPYSQNRSQQLVPRGRSFVNIIKSLYRPYAPFNPTLVLEEIKVEGGPLGGLNALSRAAELKSQAYHPPSSSGSTLTVFSPDDSRVRLPTPLTESPQPPPPTDELVPHDSALRFPSRPNSAQPMTIESATKTPRRSAKIPRIRRMSSSHSGPKVTRSSPNVTRSESPKVAREGPKTPRSGTRVGSRKDEAELKRLQSLLTDEEMNDMRKKQRRASGYVFGVRSLRNELTRLGKTF